MGSALDCVQGQGQTSNGLFLPADEWSGTTNSTSGANSSQQQQGPQSSSPNQGQSSLTQGSLPQSTLIDGKKPLQGSYDSSLAATSQCGQDTFGLQPVMNRGLNQSGDFLSGQGRLQGLMKQSSSQGSQLGSQISQGSTQQTMFQNQSESADFQGGLIYQQSHCHGTSSANVPNVSSQDPGFQEARSLVQPLGMERGQTFNQQGVLENIQKAALHTAQSHHISAPTSVYQGGESDSSVVNYQVPNQEGIFQVGHGENSSMKLTAGSRLTQQTDQGMQAMRGLALQLQGKLAHSTMQAQIPNQYLNLSAHSATRHQSPNMSSQQSLLQSQVTPDQLSSFQSQVSANNHPLSVLLQSQSPAEIQSLSQAHAQVQAANQQASVTQQALYQARKMQGGSQQPLFHSNQQSSFHSAQSAAKQAHAGSHNLHFNGQQMIAHQMQPRILSPVFQGLKTGGQQVLQRSPLGASLGFGNGVEGNIRNPMPGAIASRCIQVLMLYIQEQRKRPADNGILFWRNLVKDFFVPGAMKRWCLSSYNSSPMGKNAQGLFPMDYWFCNLCGVHPGRGFESSTDVLPRLFKIKYASGLEDELLFLDMPEERYMLPTGRLVLEFPKAVHESIFPELRVVRYGRLRVTFSSAFKIYAWEFCTMIHEEVVPRKSLLQQAHQLAKLVTEADQEGSDKNAGSLKTHCNEFTSTAKQLAIKLEAPNVNDLGFSKRYVRCLQIAEVVNSMKDLISYERKTNLGPIASLTRFPTVRKMQSEGLLAQSTQSTLSQLINQLTQGTWSMNSSYSHPLSQPSMQGQGGNHLQSAVLQPAESGVSKISQSVNQLPIQDRTQSEVCSDGLMHQQSGGQMQPPAVQAQSQSCNQPFTHLTAQSTSPIQCQPYIQTQLQISLQASGNQSVNFNQLAQQIYESAGTKQIVPQPSNLVLSQSQSLNQTGQQSLPGTPQSEMSDMRSNI